RELGLSQPLARKSSCAGGPDSRFSGVTCDCRNRRRRRHGVRAAAALSCRRMSEAFSDRLLAAIEAKGSCICVGIDPIVDLIPDAVTGGRHKRERDNADVAIDAILQFSRTVLRLVAPLVPIVKLQSAYFEQY